MPLTNSKPYNEAVDPTSDETWDYREHGAHIPETQRYSAKDKRACVHTGDSDADQLDRMKALIYAKAVPEKMEAVDYFDPELIQPAIDYYLDRHARKVLEDITGADVAEVKTGNLLIEPLPQEVFDGLRDGLPIFLAKWMIKAFLESGLGGSSEEVRHAVINDPRMTALGEQSRRMAAIVEHECCELVFDLLEDSGYRVGVADRNDYYDRVWEPFDVLDEALRTVTAKFEKSRKAQKAADEQAAASQRAQQSGNPEVSIDGGLGELKEQETSLEAAAGEGGKLPEFTSMMDALQSGEKPHPNLPQWGKMFIQDGLDMPKSLPNGLKGRKLRATDIGGVLKYTQRYCSDKMMFANKLMTHYGGAVLIDQSGSMSLSVEQVTGIMEQLPGAIIAGYSGESTKSIRSPRDGRLYNGELRIIARSGKRVAADDVHTAHGGNFIDGPAVDWLAMQEGPRYWVTDSGVSFVHFRNRGPRADAQKLYLIQQLVKTVRRARIHIVPDVEALLNGVITKRVV